MDNNLLKRLELVEKEVIEIKELLSAQTNEKVGTVKVEKPIVISSVEKQTKNTPVDKVKTAPIKEKKEFDSEKFISTWLPRVFMFILALGILWGFKLGIDNNFINEYVRVAIGYAVGLGFLLIGIRFVKGRNMGYGITLLSGFVLVNVLTTIASYALYDMISFIFAFIISLFYVAAGLYLSGKYNNEFLTVFSGVALFLLPFLLVDQDAESSILIPYLTVSFVAMFIHSMRNNHKYAYYITFALFNITLLISLVIVNVEEYSSQVEIGVGLQYLIVFLYYVYKKIDRNVFSETILYANAGSFIFFLELTNTGNNEWLYAIFFLLCVVFFFKGRVDRDSHFSGITCAIAVVFGTAALLSFNIQDFEWKVIGLTINSTVGLWVGIHYKSIRTTISAGLLYIWIALYVLVVTTPVSFISLEHLMVLTFILSVFFICSTMFVKMPKHYNIKELDLLKLFSIAYIILVKYVYQLAVWLVDSVGLQGDIDRKPIILLVLTVFGLLTFMLKKQKRIGYIASYGVYLLLLLYPMIITFFQVERNSLEFAIIMALKVVYILAVSYVLFTILKDRKFLSLSVERGVTLFILQVFYFCTLNSIYFTITNFIDVELEIFLLGQTFLLFIFSIASISFGRKEKEKWVQNFGFIILTISVFKLFFVDLHSVSLMIRTVLFLVVGAVGLVYSKTLLKNKD